MVRCRGCMICPQVGAQAGEQGGHELRPPVGDFLVRYTVAREPVIHHLPGNGAG